MGFRSSPHGIGKVLVEIQQRFESYQDFTVNSEFLIDADGENRKIWVIEAGASDPDEAEPQDIIMEKVE